MERGHVLVYCIISAWQICYKLHSYQLFKSIIINHTCNLFNIYLQCKMSLQKCSMYFRSLLPGLAWHVVNKLNYLLEFEHSHKVTRLPKNLDNHKNKVDLKNEDILNNRDKIHPQRHLNILNWEGGVDNFCKSIFAKLSLNFNFNLVRSWGSSSPKFSTPPNQPTHKWR